ncbi:hypothetical protein WHI96_13185 [Pseudonocardia tropica]|uniref:Uncharacterized protein n=1 Tax=Pseudonocardia tropica TaxID=681289 RepID=A0ABV1JVQ6_9PSEU
MSETPSQKPRHALTDTGGTPSVPLQGGPVEVPSPARPGDDVVTGTGPGEQVALPAARTSSDADAPVAPTAADADVPAPSDTDAPDAPTPDAEPETPEPRAPHAAAPDPAPDGGSADDAPTTALPVLPRPRDAAGPGRQRPVGDPTRQAPGAYVPGQYAAAAPRHPSGSTEAPHPPAARHPLAARHPMAQRPPAGFPSGPAAQAPAVQRLPGPFRAAPLPEGGGTRTSGGFRLPDFPARTRPVLPAVLGAAAAVVLALGVVTGVTGTSDASPAPAPAPVSTP